MPTRYVLCALTVPDMYAHHAVCAHPVVGKMHFSSPAYEDMLADIDNAVYDAAYCCSFAGLLPSLRRRQQRRQQQLRLQLVMALAAWARAALVVRNRSLSR